MTDTDAEPTHAESAEAAEAADDGPAAVTLRDVSFRYNPAVPVLESINLRVLPGSRLGIYGPNGGGKSTLLKVILGELEPDAGSASVFGIEPHEAAANGWIGYLPQKSEVTWQAPLTVRQVAAMTAEQRLRPWQSVPGAVSRTVDEMLELVAMDALANRPIGELSGGQQQRVFIARALAGRPRLLIFDEPTVGIDAEGRERFGALLNTIHTSLGMTLLLVSHDLRLIMDGCDAVAVLSGTLHLHSSARGVTREVLAEVFHHDIVGHDADDDGPSTPPVAGLPTADG